jgi:hypothetical protein
MRREGFSTEAIQRFQQLRAQCPTGGNYKRLLDWVTAQSMAGSKEVNRLCREAGVVIINSSRPGNN